MKELLAGFCRSRKSLSCLHKKSVVVLQNSLCCFKAKWLAPERWENIFLQLFFDVINPFKKHRSMLNGPTNEVWIYSPGEVFAKYGSRVPF